MRSGATIASPPDRLLALERANEIRRARAQLKRRIGAGHLSAAEVIVDCPVEARRWPVAELLALASGIGVPPGAGSSLRTTGSAR